MIPLIQNTTVTQTSVEQTPEQRELTINALTLVSNHCFDLLRNNQATTTATNLLLDLKHISQSLHSDDFILSEIRGLHQVLLHNQNLYHPRPQCYSEDKSKIFRLASARILSLMEEKNQKNIWV